MDFKTLDKQLFDAVGREKEEVRAGNPYREIAFDCDKKRLGWVNPASFTAVTKSLESLKGILEGKENFIFTGMGGSANGVKTLLSLFKKHSIYTIDSLDPAALKELTAKIKNFDKTLVVAVSKSGTTKETQLICSALKVLFGKNWQNHFLWLADPQAFPKLDSLGWEKTPKIAIQPDGESDIGGRFSCPHTLIFFLPLYLLLNKNTGKISLIYEAYRSKLEEIRKKGYAYAEKYSKEKIALLHPMVPSRISAAFSSWVIQLFQESLGSKNSLEVKTLEPFERARKGFLPLKLGIKFKNPVSGLMAQMYFFQAFLVYYSAMKNINFVNQDYVEKYKGEMRKLENEEAVLETMNLKEIISAIKKQVSKNTLFIEAVLYFHAGNKTVKTVKAAFAKEFKDKKIFVFIGSDWNHHSYQAAFADKNTFYALIAKSNYQNKISRFDENMLNGNIKTLKLIAKATYLTIKDKAILCALES